MSSAAADLGPIVAAAIAAANPERLVLRRFGCRGDELLLDAAAWEIPVRLTGRLLVVGGGKAAAGVAAALETLAATAGVPRTAVSGLVSVPEGCGRRLDRIEVRETRPAGTNLPTAAAVVATRDMLARMEALGPDDLAIAVITGGGSAVLEDPVAGVSLEDVVAVTRHLSSAGADIRELNLVRQAVSRIKAGGLARSCRAGRLLVVVLSDVIGDPLDLIASGPCMPLGADPRAALEILAHHAATAVAPAITHRLEQTIAAGGSRSVDLAAGGDWTTPAGCRVSHVVLGSNATAVDAAAHTAAGLGYEIAVRHATPGIETADAVGDRLAREGAELAARVRVDGRPRGIVEGGEAVVRLPPDHGRGGRNQQTALAAVDALLRRTDAWPTGLVVASVGTDGEDGPTDAAGGFASAEVAVRLRAAGINVARAVDHRDAFTALGAADSLIKTGPTGTNVADVRIVLVRP